MKYFIILFAFSLALTSCKKENSIQTFFVKHQEEPDYSVIDISSTLLDVEKADMSEEDKATYQSLDKLHVLLYNAADSLRVTDYETELKAINKVFSNPDYTELMEFKSDGIKFKINSIGEEDTVDEVLILASAKEKGFAAIRVIGDDMRPDKIANVITKMKDADIDEGKLKGIMDFLK